MPRWENLLVPLENAAGIKKKSTGLTPDQFNALGADGWEAVGSAASWSSGRSCCSNARSSNALVTNSEQHPANR